jgi:ribosomal protein S4
MTYLKFKACRRIGENIWFHKKLTPRQSTLINLLLKKNTTVKESDFSKRLRNMKKLAFFYGIRSGKLVSANTCYNYLDKKKSLLLTLENRLDVILVRLYFCSTLFTARQLITHKKICVNFNIVNIPSAKLRNGDLISVVPNYLESVKVNVKLNLQNNCLKNEPVGAASQEPKGRKQNSNESYGWTSETTQNTPDSASSLLMRTNYHLEVNYKTLNAILLYEPTQIHFPYKIDLDFLF